MRGGVDPKYMDKQITLYNRPTTPSNETAAAVPDLRPVWRVPNEPASAAAVGVVVVEVAAVVVPQDLTANSPGGCLQYQQVQRTTTSTSLLSFRFRLRGCGRCSGGLSPRCFASPCRRRTMFLRPRRCTSGAYSASPLIPMLIPEKQRPLTPPSIPLPCACFEQVLLLQLVPSFPLVQLPAAVPARHPNAVNVISARLLRQEEPRLRKLLRREHFRTLPPGKRLGPPRHGVPAPVLGTGCRWCSGRPSTNRRLRLPCHNVPVCSAKT